MFINIFQSFKPNSELSLAVENRFNEQSKWKGFNDYILYYLRFLIKTIL